MTLTHQPRDKVLISILRPRFSGFGPEVQPSSSWHEMAEIRRSQRNLRPHSTNAMETDDIDPVIGESGAAAGAAVATAIAAFGTL